MLDVINGLKYHSCSVTSCPYTIQYMKLYNTRIKQWSQNDNHLQQASYNPCIGFYPYLL